MSNDRILQTRTASDITLADGLSSCAQCFPDAVGLFYSPTKCQFGKVRGTIITDESDRDLALTGIFEARIFNLQAELRWLNVSNGEGKAVLLSQSAYSDCLTYRGEHIEAIDIIDSQYLLWGEGNQNTTIREGWSWLSSARIGKLAVPIAGINSQERVKLRFREYLSECDDYGNVAVVEERLLGLSKYSTK